MAKGAKTKMPTSVKIGSAAYQVTQDPIELQAARLEAREGELWGSTLHRDLKIVVSPDLAPYQQQTTLLHECLHAMLHVYGGEPATEAAMKMDQNDLEEAFVSRLDNAVMSLLRDNPKLVAYLTGLE